MTGAIGQDVARLEGRDKVTGTAVYAFEQDLPGCLFAWPVRSRIAHGRITRVRRDAVLGLPGVVAVLAHDNAPRLAAAPDDAELAVLQGDEVSYRGQFVALVVASTQEAAREGAGRLEIDYDEGDHDVVLRVDHPRLYAPDEVNPDYPTDSVRGDPDRALGDAAVAIDATYSTAACFNNPMEPHATTAVWDGDALLVHDSTQGSTGVARDLRALFGVKDVRVLAQHVGGGFGSKGSTRPNAVLAVMAARVTGRPVKLALTRQMMFANTGYRTPTIQRVALGATPDGSLRAIVHEAYEQTSTIFEYAEQTTEATRHLYAAPHRRTTHRLAALDVPTPRWMRAPGEAPGMFALESAMDELAIALSMDPIVLRLRNDTQVDPESGKRFSSRHLAECLREGATRFGWDARDPRPAVRRSGPWLIGTGVASAVYPVYVMPSSARATALDGGRFEVAVNATDIGTGARTVLTQIAADALRVPMSSVDVLIGDSALPSASVAGGSAGTSSWGWAVANACASLLADGRPRPGASVTASNREGINAMADLERNAYGAHFVEARVDLRSGEVRVPRMLCVVAAGAIMNPRTARSQLIGGMTMGLSMALHEEGVLDPVIGHYANHDLASYHVAANADVVEQDVVFLPETDSSAAPMGGKGIGEIGIVGTAAAVASAVAHACGVRVRSLPIQPDKLLTAGLPEP